MTVAVAAGLDPLGRLRGFVQAMTRLVTAAADDEPRLLQDGGGLLADLVSDDGWLPEAFAQPHPDHYQQYLLHCDPLERFSVVSFVWGPGQATPVHDHTVWGLVGMLRGAEVSVPYARQEDGRLVACAPVTLAPGTVEPVSPTVGDIHLVRNAVPDGVSVSIHVYGANIGAVRRHVFDPKTGSRKPFVSGYAAPVMPNVWDRAVAVRAEIA